MAQAMQPIQIIEVGPRDGLQDEPAHLPVEARAALITGLARTGVAEIEVGAFVSPRAVPQLADTEAVVRRLTPVPGVMYSALVPNERGLDRALAAGVPKIAVFTAASETFTRQNINATISESLARFRSVVARAKQAGIIVRGYISTVVWCPYEGRIPAERVGEVLDALLDLGVDEVALGETLGKAAPPDIRRLLDQMLRIAPRDRLALHLHDTYGLAIANALVAWDEYGITRFDSSAGGLGGCPYAPGAAGNVATEDLVYAFKASGATVPVDETAVTAAVSPLEEALGHPLNSRYGRAYGLRGPKAARATA